MRSLLRFWILSLTAVLIEEAVCLPPRIKIGAIFSESEEEQEAAFRFAIERINADANILPGTTLNGHVERVNPQNSYGLEKKLCTLLHEGVAGIIGPLSEITTMHTRSICDALEIPHIQVHWDVEARYDAVSINLYPRPEILAKAYMDVARGLSWNDFAIVYDHNEQIVLYKDVFTEARKKDWKVKVYQLNDTKPFRATFDKLKADGKKNIILDVKHYNLMEALKNAQQVGLMTEAQNYIVTSMDFITEELEDYIYSGARIFTFRMIEDKEAELATLFHDWPFLADGTGRANLPPPRMLKTESGLIYDAVKLLAASLGRLDRSQAVEIRQISCVDEVPWFHGTSLINFMRPIVFRGLSGLVAFDEFGQRSTFTLDVLTLTRQGVESIGYWTSRGGLNISSAWLGSYSEFATNQRPLIVTTLVNEPFTMTKASSSPKSGNEEFEGYAMDLIKELSLLLNFEFEIRICKDGLYGIEDDEGNWNGMIGEVIRGEADIAVADLTITGKREKAVDFTLPFMTTGVSILFMKPAKAESSLFGFLSPFTISVWIYLLLTTALISLIFFICGRLSPYEWDNPFPCKEDQPILMNECSVKNSFWFTVGSLMQQGSDVAPKAMSTRIIGGIWYFFTLIMVASYTANLAAFLTIEVVSYPFNNIEELAAQTKIGYGCTKSGSTRTTFKDSPNPTLRKLVKYMEDNPRMFAANNEEGKARVLKGNYAYFMESRGIEHTVERICNVTQIGGLLDNKGYGIATRKNSPIRHDLSRGILKLQEMGTLHILYERWWKQRRGGGSCQDSKSGGASPMALANVGGVFVVLVVGSLFSFLLALLELFYATRKVSPDRESMWESIREDFRFMCKLQEYTKPNRNKKSAVASLSGSKGKKTSVASGITAGRESGTARNVSVRSMSGDFKSISENTVVQKNGDERKSLRSKQISMS